ncbi:MAG: class I adenylate-forming enzyme family protein, partial [Acidimicrobiales bacterium]
AVPDRTAAALGGETLTFGQLNRRANQVAALLTRRGLRRGDRLVTWSATALDLVPVFAAAAKLGVVFAPANAALSIDEAASVIAPARPALIVAGDGRPGDGTELAGRLGAQVLGVSELTGLAATEEDVEPGAPQPSEHDPHVIFFTSGSSGRPKGAVLTHRVNFLRTHPGALLERRGPMVSPYPLFHMGAWTIALQQWQGRDAVILLPSADAASICEAVVGHRAERLNCIPAVWRRVLDHLATPGGRDLDMSSVRFADTGTSATPPALLAAIDEAFPRAVVRVFYGSTEAGSVCSLDHRDLYRKPGSCGVPAPSCQVRVDEGGELWVRGPLVFDGYFEDDEATAAALDDGWYRTGDLAEVDGEGYLSIVGRAGDVLRTGGETVAPAEVEAVLAEHPDLADVAVVGWPDAQWGEVVCAVVVGRPGHPVPTVDDLRAHCGSRLAAFKQPRRLAVVESIPRTPSTHQVRRPLLVEQLGTAPAPEHSA